MRRTPVRMLGRPIAAAVAALVMLGLLTATPEEPAREPAVPVAASESTTTVFYYTKTKNWSAYRLHYAPDGGAWTTVPGVAMEAACTDWVKRTVGIGSASGLSATFNDGSGVWDNNAGRNYALGTGTITVKDGVVAHSDPCAGTGTEPEPRWGPNRRGLLLHRHGRLDDGQSPLPAGGRDLDGRARCGHGTGLHRLGEEVGGPGRPPRP